MNEGNSLKEYVIIEVGLLCQDCGRSECVTEKLTKEEVEKRVKSISKKYRVYKMVRDNE